MPSRRRRQGRSPSADFKWFGRYGALLPLFWLVGALCIAALWRVKSLLRHRSDRPKLTTSVGIRSSTRFTIYLCILCVQSSASMPVSGCGRASRRGGLLVEPHVGQVLIEVVAPAPPPAPSLA